MKDEYIKKLKDAHQKLLKALNLAPNEGYLFDKWSKKEIMAHIAGWYEEGVLGTSQILKGEKPTSFRMSIEGYNKRSVEKRKNMTVSEIQSEMINLHKQWLLILENLDENRLTHFYGTKLAKKDINLIWIIKEAISHDLEHAEALEAKFK